MRHRWIPLRFTAPLARLLPRNPALFSLKQFVLR